MWRTPTIGLPGKPGGDTWGGLPAEKRAGAEAWMPGTYDSVTGLVIWGTAQAKPWTRDARGTEGDALFSSSTLALDPKTGEMKWYFQHVPGESYDMDEVFERVLVDYDGHSSVFTMGKLGILWELDRKTGKFVRAVDMGYQDQVSVDAKTGRTQYRPRMVQKTGEPIYFCPGTGGLKTLRAMAYNPSTRALVYTADADVREGDLRARPGRGDARRLFPSEVGRQSRRIRGNRPPTGKPHVDATPPGAVQLRRPHHRRRVSSSSARGIGLRSPTTRRRGSSCGSRACRRRPTAFRSPTRRTADSTSRWLPARRSAARAGLTIVPCGLSAGRHGEPAEGNSVCRLRAARTGNDSADAQS